MSYKPRPSADVAGCPGTLSNARHEAFAQALASGMTADAAYQAAGYRHSRGNAARLKANESIRKRVAAITARAAMRAEVGKADVMRHLMREAGMTEDRPDDTTSSARITALRLLGLELGMFPEKREHDVTDRMAELIRNARPLPIGMSAAPAPGKRVIKHRSPASQRWGHAHRATLLMPPPSARFRHLPV